MSARGFFNAEVSNVATGDVTMTGHEQDLLVQQSLGHLMSSSTSDNAGDLDACLATKRA